MASRFFSLSVSSCLFSLLETIKIAKLNIKIKVWRMKVISPKNLFIKSKTINIIDDLKKTWNLNTAIIEKEWIIRLVNDILEGPKKRFPLMESISFNFSILFFNVPE